MEEKFCDSVPPLGLGRKFPCSLAQVLGRQGPGGLAWNHNVVLSGCLGFCLSRCVESLGLCVSRKRKNRKTLRWHYHVFLYFPIKVSLLLLQVVEIRMERSVFSVHMCWVLFHMAPRVRSLLGHLL